VTRNPKNQKSTFVLLKAHLKPNCLPNRSL
jgi:hypothetical protein